MAVEAKSPPIPVDDLGELWKRFEDASADEIVAEVVRDYRDDEETRRDLLASWLGYQLGYSRYLNRRESLETEPLWDLLDASVFEQLGEQGERALSIVAKTRGDRLRTTLHPKAAVAAVVLWLNGSNPEIVEEAKRLLTENPLPDEDAWLYKLVCRLVTVGRARGLSRPGLFQLAALQLGSRYWHNAAKLAGLYLVKRCSPTSSVPDTFELTHACDLAAETRRVEEGDWLKMLTEAAIGGALRFPWLEKPVEATLRSAVGEPEYAERVRAFHRRRLYDVDYKRLDELYGHLLDASVGDDSRLQVWARRRLLEEIQLSLEENPPRALRLAELVAIHEHPLRIGTFHRRLLHATRQIESKPKLDLLDELLAGLYVATYEVEPHAFKLVHRVSDRIDWERIPVASEEKLDLYLKVSDYDRAFRNLSFDFEGVTLQLADKDAAIHVAYFREKRFEPTSVIRFVQRMLSPIEWMGSTLRVVDPAEDAAEQGLELFDNWLRDRNLAETVVEDYVEAGVPIAEYGDVAKLGADFIDDSVSRLRNRRVLAAAGAGLAAGGCGPLQIPFLSLSDVPVSLGLSLDVCTRFCWYYGFDPREHPRLPAEILAVALEGPRPEHDEREALFRRLAEFGIQTSFLVEAVGTRSLGRIAHRTLRGLVEQFSQSGYGDALAALVGEIAELRLRWQSKDRRPAPFQGALLGAALDAALVYDVCESAQALLSDRFLERKYADWEPRLGWPD